VRTARIGQKQLVLRKEVCVHYWIIDRQNLGHCRNCGAERDFRPKLLSRKMI